MYKYTRVNSKFTRPRIIPRRLLPPTRSSEKLCAQSIQYMIIIYTRVRKLRAPGRKFIIILL